jgi:hypothetical protein
MDSFHVNDAGQQASPPSSIGAAAPLKRHPIWRYIATFSIASFVVGTLCGYFALKTNETFVEEDDLAAELNVGVDTLLMWFPDKNANLRSKKKDIVFHMMSFTDDSDPAVSNLLIDTTDASDDKDKQVVVLDRRLQTAPKCKDAVLDFILAFSGWLKSFVKFAVTNENELRSRITKWLDTNVVGPTAFQKFISKIVDFAYKTSVKDKLKSLWGIIKDAWKRGGGWIKELFKLTMDHAIDKAWPKTKTLVKLAAQIGTWVKKGPSEFIGQATLQYLATEAMVKNAKKLKACSNMTIFR